MIAKDVPMEEVIANNAVNGLITRVLFGLDAGTPSDNGVEYNYKSVYYRLFNGMLDVISLLTEKRENGADNADVYLETINALKQLQYDTEEQLISQPEVKNPRYLETEGVRCMSGFEDSLGKFLVELRNNILESMLLTNTKYKELKKASMELAQQLMRLEQNAAIDDLFDSRQSMDAFSLNFCFLCGMKDSTHAENRDPEGNDITSALEHSEGFKRLHTAYETKRNALRAILPSEAFDLLTEYINIRKSILTLEKIACYAGAVRDKERLIKLLNPTNDDKWNTLLMLIN